MNGVLAAGIGLTTVGAAGYLVGLVVAYPGRAFSVTGVMLGITLVAIGRESSEDHSDRGGRSEGRDDDATGGEPT